MKINKLLTSTPQGIVLLSSWLTNRGYSLDLQKRYRSSHWLKSIGTGAMVREGEKTGYEGGIYALQQQLGLSIHPGGKTALSLLGKAQYLQLGSSTAVLYGTKNEKLPVWFKYHTWGLSIQYHASEFLPPNVGLVEYELKNFAIKISGAARALMEYLYVLSDPQELIEAYELMENLNSLNPNLVQSLLEQCTSVKVKRLFLYMAEKAGHDWCKHINLKKIDIGKGNRSFISNGSYVSKYKIVVPKNMEENGKTNL